MNDVGLLITNKTNVHWDSYFEMYIPYYFHLLIRKDKQKTIYNINTMKKLISNCFAYMLSAVVCALLWHTHTQKHSECEQPNYSSQGPLSCKV